MKNIENWKPSVYKKDKNGTLVAHECADCSHFVVNVNALQMQDVIEKYAKGDVVDLGCGKVPLYVLYKDISRINSVFCVDWSNTFHGGEHVDLVADLSQKLSVDDCKFDTVVSTSVLEHLPDVKIAFEEFNRILKNDGHVILQVPFLYWIHEAPFDYCRYTHFYLEKISKENNLKIVERRIICDF